MGGSCEYVGPKRLSWKLIYSEPITDIINNFAKTWNSPYTSRDIQAEVKRITKAVVPLHIIRKYLKENLNLSWKRIPSRRVEWNLETISLQKLLFSIKISKWFGHLKYLVNIDESTFNRTTRIFYSWAQKGDHHPLRNLHFINSVSTISAISSTGKVFNKLLTSTLKAPDFVNFLSNMLSEIRSESSLRNNEIGIILDNSPVHWAKAVISFLKEENISVYFIPPYWPELEPIEKYFSILKRIVCINAEDKSINLKLKEGAEHIENWIKEIPTKTIINLWNYFYDELTSIVRGLNDIIKH